MSRLEWASNRDVDVLGLVSSQLGQLGTQLGQMQGCNLLIQVLRQHIHLVLIATRLALIPQLQLGNDLCMSMSKSAHKHVQYSYLAAHNHKHAKLQAAMKGSRVLVDLKGGCLKMYVNIAKPKCMPEEHIVHACGQNARVQHDQHGPSLTGSIPG